MTSPKSTYIPALNKTWLTPVYDSVLKWGMREETFKRYLVESVGVQPGWKVLDLGCGTGTLTILLKQHQPQAEIFGLDGDPQVLEIAREKARSAGVDIRWKEGMAYTLPYPDQTFERVVSCLMIHHLTAEDKIRAFHEVYRVLRPGGEGHVLDFGKPNGWAMRFISVWMAHMEEAGDNMRGRIPSMLWEGGFHTVNIPRRFKTIFGELSHFQVSKT